MFVKEIWRYPIKSMAGERMGTARLGTLGIAGDRAVLVARNGRVVTSRTHSGLLGLHSTLGVDGVVRVEGHAWDSPAALALVREVAGADADLHHLGGEGHFDVLPLLVATDGAIAAFGEDARRLRPNLIIGGVEGLAEREWPGRRLRIGDAILAPAQLRSRCVMTTFDPDTLVQDIGVLRRLVREFDGTMALDTEVIRGGEIREGDSVEFV